MHIRIVENNEHNLKILCAVTDVGNKRYIFTYDDDYEGFKGIYEFLKKAFKKEKGEIITIEFFDAPVYPEVLDRIFPEKIFLE